MGRKEEKKITLTHSVELIFQNQKFESLRIF